jgi:hypothetical protein
MGNVALALANLFGSGGSIERWGQSNVVARQITMSSSYATGGDSVPLALLGLTKVGFGFFVGYPAAPTVDFILRFIQGATPKVMAFRTGGAGAVNYAQGDIKGSVTVDVPIASGSLPTNGQLLSTLAAANNTTAFTIALQPDIARNVGVSLKNLVAGASTGNAASYVIVGTFRGAAQTETITFSALELTSTAQNEVATKYGSKPFDSITSVTPSAAQPASWSHALGPGSKLGLPVDPTNNLEADIIHLFKNAADLAKTGLYSTANKTVNFGTLADGDDIAVEYNAGAGSGLEVASTTDLSSVSQNWIFVGE